MHTRSLTATSQRKILITLFFTLSTAVAFMARFRSLYPSYSDAAATSTSLAALFMLVFIAQWTAKDISSGLAARIIYVNSDRTKFLGHRIALVVLLSVAVSVMYSLLSVVASGEFTLGGLVEAIMKSSLVLYFYGVLTMTVALFINNSTFSIIATLSLLLLPELLLPQLLTSPEKILLIFPETHVRSLLDGDSVATPAIFLISAGFLCILASLFRMKRIHF